MPNVRVADFIATSLADHGLTQVFLVTGGGAMHLNDAIGREKRLRWTCCHHEQACAMAAQSFARMSGRPAIVNVTTGPGGTNAITGVFGAWCDSLPMVVVSGQVKWETTVASTGLPLRQLGDQEADIVSMVRPITKYARMVTDPKDIRRELERALRLSVSGRPGPVWLDVPGNVQGAIVDPSTLEAYDPSEDPLPHRATDVKRAARDVLARLREAKRPAILVGSGVRIAGAHELFLRAVEALGVPVATAFNAHDALTDDHPLYVGRPSSVGDRPGNFAVQNTDFLLVLGCRLNVRQIGYRFDAFARAAYKVMVDIDAAELQKPTLHIDMKVHADLSEFLSAILDLGPIQPTEAHREYLAWCLERRRRYPVVLPEHDEDAHGINPYAFSRDLFASLPEGAAVVTGDGTACVTTFQAARIRRGQRLYSDSGSAPMGYDLPAAVGASLARPGERVVCIAGDGSIMMNVQELQTIVTHQLPILLFVLNNGGYHSIRQTQNNYFADNIVGVGRGSGLDFPDFVKLAAAFGLPSSRVRTRAELNAELPRLLAGQGPALCEVMIDPAQGFSPKMSSKRLPDGRMVSAPLEDMAPFLSRDELRQNMLIPILDEAVSAPGGRDP
jgi:acetolactate synthase-1/2/3 large subunit